MSLGGVQAYLGGVQSAGLGGGVGLSHFTAGAIRQTPRKEVTSHGIASGENTGEGSAYFYEADRTLCSASNVLVIFTLYPFP